MLAIGIVLNIIGIGFFCWLLFTLAIYALPCFVAVSAGLSAYHSGSGPIGAITIGFLADAATLLVAQLIFSWVRIPLVRFAVALLFSAPAAFAGYHAIYGLAALTIGSQTWQFSFATIGAIVIGTTAWARLVACPLTSGATQADRAGSRGPSSGHGLTA